MASIETLTGVSKVSDFVTDVITGTINSIKFNNNNGVG